MVTQQRPRRCIQHRLSFFAGFTVGVGMSLLSAGCYLMYGNSYSGPSSINGSFINGTGSANGTDSTSEATSAIARTLIGSGVVIVAAVAAVAGLHRLESNVPGADVYVEYAELPQEGTSNGPILVPPLYEEQNPYPVPSDPPPPYEQALLDRRPSALIETPPNPNIGQENSVRGAQSVLTPGPPPLYRNATSERSSRSRRGSGSSLVSLPPPYQE